MGKPLIPAQAELNSPTSIPLPPPQPITNLVGGNPFQIQGLPQPSGTTSNQATSYAPQGEKSWSSDDLGSHLATQHATQDSSSSQTQGAQGQSIQGLKPVGQLIAKYIQNLTNPASSTGTQLDSSSMIGPSDNGLSALSSGNVMGDAFGGQAAIAPLIAPTDAAMADSAALAF